MGAFFHNLTPEIKVTVAEKIEFVVNMSYNMRHALVEGITFPKQMLNVRTIHDILE